MRLVLDWDGTCTVRDSLVAAVHDIGDPAVYDREFGSYGEALAAEIDGIADAVVAEINDVVDRIAGSLGVDPEHFREYRLRVITDRLEAMPELVDRLYRRLSV